MPEPTTSAATFAGATIAVPVLTAFGVPLGLRPDVLIAGFAGALVSIVLLNAVPSAGDTWRHLVRTTGRRMCVVIAGSLTAGYLTPMLLTDAAATAWLLGTAFVVGAAAQRVLQVVIRKWFADQPDPPSGPSDPPGPTGLQQQHGEGAQ